MGVSWLSQRSIDFHWSSVVKAVPANAKPQIKLANPFGVRNSLPLTIINHLSIIGFIY